MTVKRTGLSGIVKQNKYKAVKSNGFDSKMEERFFQMLVLKKVNFEKQKKYILQDRYNLEGEQIREISYTADFILTDLDIVIDIKGYSTKDFIIKKKIFGKIYGKKIHCLTECPKIYEAQNKDRLFKGWIDVSLLKKLQTKRKKEDEKLGKVRKKEKIRSKNMKREDLARIDKE